MNKSEPLAYGLKEFSQSVGISLRTLYTHLERGTGPEGRRRLVTRDAGKAWLEANIERP